MAQTKYKSPAPEHHIFIIDTITQKSLKIQNVPKEISYDPKSDFKTIPIVSRNNPLYHYTGSEDTIEMELTWYADEDDRADVITNCRWLESLSKADGYSQAPHPVILSMDNLFDANSKWLVENAQYKLTMLSKLHGMLPVLATQKLTLKRITTTSLTYNQIQAVHL